jgi:hypothetical protein
MKNDFFYPTKGIVEKWIIDGELEGHQKLGAHMGPLTCFPSKLLLNVPSPRNHIQGTDKSGDPLGLRDVLSSLLLFTE